MIVEPSSGLDVEGTTAWVWSCECAVRTIQRHSARRARLERGFRGGQASLPWPREAWRRFVRHCRQERSRRSLP